MLNINKHELIIKNILRDIYLQPLLQTQLVFKGGTCLYLFHDLSRFSTDLDFSLRQNTVEENFDYHLVEKILTPYLTLSDFKNKHFTWFWLGSYEAGQQKIKLEISKRIYQAESYLENDFFGLTVPSLDLSTMFAHKLCAITDRKKMVSRDLYDAWWLFKRMAPVNEAIVLSRTGLSVPAYLQTLLEFIPKHISNDGILSGLGELLTPAQKDWVKDHLLSELLFQISNFLGAYTLNQKLEHRQ